MPTTEGFNSRDAADPTNGHIGPVFVFAPNLSEYSHLASRNMRVSDGVDGQQQRDCLYVTDVVEALGRAALQVAACAVNPGEVINLGHTEVLGLLQIAEIVVSRAGQSSTISCIPWPEELARIDIGGFSGDYAKAHRLLNWTPQVAFADGIEQTLDFYRRYSWYL